MSESEKGPPLYPAPYAKIYDLRMGKDTKILGEQWYVDRIRPEPAAEGKPTRKNQYEFGAYADGVCVAALKPGEDIQILRLVVKIMNDFPSLRGMWDPLSAEQIPLVHRHMAGLLSAYRGFFKVQHPEILRAKTRLRDQAAWVAPVDAFLKAAAKHRLKSQNIPALVNPWGYEPFWNRDGTLKTASRIYYRDPAGDKHTLFVMVGHDPDCPQAKKFHGETIAATVEHVLQLSPDPSIGWKFLVAVAAIRGILRDVESAARSLEGKLRAIGITPHSRPDLFEPLGVMQMHCEELRRCFDVWDSKDNRIEAVLWTDKENRLAYHERRRQRREAMERRIASIPEVEERAAKAYGVRARPQTAAPQ